MDEALWLVTKMNAIKNDITNKVKKTGPYAGVDQWMNRDLHYKNEMFVRQEEKMKGIEFRKKFGCFDGQRVFCCSFDLAGAFYDSCEH